MTQLDSRSLIVRGLQRLGNVRASETRALAWACLYVFVLFLAYYVLRPIRDELGVAGGVRNLPWLFTGTLVAMLTINPLFSYVVRSWPRERFIAITYRFFMANLLVFLLLLKFADPIQQVWVGRAFFIWVSVFNLFVVSVFWSLMVDVFNTEQGKRLFGFLGAGATLGGIAGSSLTSGLVATWGQTWLLMACVVLLEVAVFSARRMVCLCKDFQRSEDDESTQRALGGGVLAGMSHTLRSPYLLGIAAFILLYSVTSTVLYFQQAAIAEASFADRPARTAFFAEIDFWVNVLTLFFQLFVTGRLLKRMGVTFVLCALPLCSVIGFTSLSLSSTVAVFVAVQVARRVSNFALARPTREILFTSVTREDRYKAKNFIDTVVYRAGDQVGSWSYAAMLGLGLSMSGTAIVAVPLSLGWLFLSAWLGLRHERQKTIPNEDPARGSKAYSPAG
ncbi:NTP/NDP exchange transporter [Xanthomonas arboricola]|uniref:NTP/NDP exchange transporter n=1 Tax=Xanthomonas arboricola TaxID=56448 RepID=UPI0016131E96|nr:MFS transporter [Xanthomonas arboricola]MBB4596477.1 AAA family ATP:ADP antiporter [Xanthomonas arboricola]